MKHRLLYFSIGLMTCQAFAQRPISVPLADNPKAIAADLYGSGNRGIILAHGGRFDRKSWRKQAPVLAAAGFVVLAISFRGDGLNKDGSPGSSGSDADNATDVLAAVSYFRQLGVKKISAVGGSLGGSAVGEADARSKPGTFDRIVFLASEGGDNPEMLSGRKLFILARDDEGPSGPRIGEISKHYAKAPQPKRLIVVEGSAHAQFLFETDQGPRVMKEILNFLTEP